jgi:hypothetical protein
MPVGVFKLVWLFAAITVNSGGRGSTYYERSIDFRNHLSFSDCQNMKADMEEWVTTDDRFSYSSFRCVRVDR